jgi:RND family efflux transporter MFP subunit
MKIAKQNNVMKLLNSLRKFVPAVVILTLVGIGCSSPDETTSQTEEAIPVEIQKASLNQTSASFQYSGTVASERTVNLSTKIMGRVTQLDVDEGDYVQQGEVLVRIKDDNLQAQKSQVQASLQEARAGLKNTETNYNRMKALYEKESATKKELDDITTQYEMAKAKVKALEGKLREINDMLEYAVLEAPFNGYVVGKRVDEGDMAGPGQPLIAFEQESRMKVEITVPETQIMNINIGDTVSVDIKAASLKNIIGTVANLNPSGNRASRQFTVEVRLPELDKSSGVKSGMFAQVGLTSVGDPVITVPRSAIIERGQLTGIYTLNGDSEVLLRWIRLGDESGDEVEVLSGLAPGEAYVSKFDGNLREGQKVRTQ